jgi:hypothetical protein
MRIDQFGSDNSFFRDDKANISPSEAALTTPRTPR